MCLVTLSARSAAVTTRVAPPVMESLILNVSITLAFADQSSSTTTEYVKKLQVSDSTNG